MKSASKYSHYVEPALAKITPMVFGIAITTVLVAGWLDRGEERLTAEAGLGYWLGIAGGAAMLLLLIYALRKRSRSMRSLGSVRLWFRLHMILGVVGPTLVLFHANFKLGSLNSNVALFTMLIVAGSGIVGRYLYGKIHLGLYGRKAEMKEILADAQALKTSLGQELLAAESIVKQLSAFSHRVMSNPPSGVLASVWCGGTLTVRARLLRARLLAEARRLIAREGKTRGWSWWERRGRLAGVSDVIRMYFSAVVKAAEFTFYERLFSLWHVLHVPLFLLMALAGIVHVWAVHHY